MLTSVGTLYKRPFQTAASLRKQAKCHFRKDLIRKTSLKPLARRTPNCKLALTPERSCAIRASNQFCSMLYCASAPSSARAPPRSRPRRPAAPARRRAPRLSRGSSARSAAGRRGRPPPAPRRRGSRAPRGGGSRRSPAGLRRRLKLSHVLGPVTRQHLQPLPSRDRLAVRAAEARLVEMRRIARRLHEPRVRLPHLRHELVEAFVRVEPAAHPVDRVGVGRQGPRRTTERRGLHPPGGRIVGIDEMHPNVARPPAVDPAAGGSAQTA